MLTLMFCLCIDVDLRVVIVLSDYQRRLLIVFSCFCYISWYHVQPHHISHCISLRAQVLLFKFHPWLLFFVKTPDATDSILLSCFSNAQTNAAFIRTINQYTDILNICLKSHFVSLLLSTSHKFKSSFFFNIFFSKLPNNW